MYIAHRKQPQDTHTDSHTVYSTSKIRLIRNYKQTTKSTVCVNYDFTTAVIQSRQQVGYVPGKSWHITEQIYDFARP